MLAPSEESKRIAIKLVNDAVADAVLAFPDIMIAKIAVALEASWQQGLDDAYSYRRVVAAIKDK